MRAYKQDRVESVSHIPSAKDGATVFLVTLDRDEKPTVAMRREDLMGLVAQTVPDEAPGVSPIAVIAIVAMFVGLFVAIVQVS
jgi:hypothetical protein